MPKFSRDFDSIYEANAPGVPLDYLRSLAAFESNSNPKSQPAHGHIGLLQVGQGPLDDYNKATGENRKLAELVDPVLNVKVFFQYYKLTLRVFAQLVDSLGAVRSVNFQEDWSNKQFALLVTASWNSGIGAVKLVATKSLIPLAATLQPITHAEMFRTARLLGGEKLPKLFSLAKEAWQVQVVAAMKTLQTGRKEGLILPGKKKKKDGGSWALLLLAALWMLSRKSN